MSFISAPRSGQLSSPTAGAVAAALQAAVERGNTSTLSDAEGLRKRGEDHGRDRRGDIDIRYEIPEPSPWSDGRCPTFDFNSGRDILARKTIRLAPRRPKGCGGPNDPPQA